MVEEKKLHACLEQETGDVFYASLISQHSASCELRSSYDLKKGAHILMMPVSDTWDGKTIQSSQIKQSDQTFEATINRVERKGVFQIRNRTQEEHDIVARLRHGKALGSTVETEILTAGLVTTIKLSGRVDLEDSAHFQSIIRKLDENKKLILIDVTNLNAFSRSAAGIFNLFIKDEIKKNRIFAFLVKPGSHTEDNILHTKLPQLVKLFTDREEAVTHLLQETLD
jgi:hypothetical protein